LIPFGLGLLLFILYAFFNIYHLLRFATYSFATYLITVIFIGGAVIIGATTYQCLITYDWSLAWVLTDFFQTTNL
jgi:hypothetical protein